MQKIVKEIKHNQIGKRFTSLLLAFSMVFSMFAICGPFLTAYAASENLESPSGVIDFGDASVKYDTSLKDNGDGTFSFVTDLYADTSTQDENVNKDTSSDSYFEAPFTGEYLVQLWGGNGGEGGDSLVDEATPGGKGGYVYGVMALKKGDIILYKIGGDGDTTIQTDEGGGANGDGGAHGNKGNYSVGGGGGYSSLFYFPQGEDANYFLNTYTDGNGNLINVDENAFEADRISRYIMIAGGGGGSGAGSGPVNAIGDIIKHKNRTAQGGQGGDIVTSTAIAVDGGIVYAGKDGSSAGDSLDYIGHGGSNVPGTPCSTLYDWNTSSVKPNDWFATVNPSLPGGRGGSGNFRGGAGGAGYTGGSGGIQTSKFSATNVGGGGGGSSYISTTYVNVDKATTNYNDKLIYTNPTDKNEGGYIDIQYLGKQDDATDASFIDGISVTSTISEYFDIKSIKAERITESGATTLTNGENTYTSVSGNTFTFGYPRVTSGDITRYTLTIAPKANFVGGNDVSIFSSDITVIPNKAGLSNVNILTGNIEETNVVKYVNIPFNFTAVGYTLNAENDESLEHTYLVGTTTTIKGTDLVDANHSSKQANVGTGMYTYVGSISNYTISGISNNNAIIHITETTSYDVSYKVTPISAATKAVVGRENPASGTTFSAKAVINVKAPGTIVLYEGDGDNEKSLIVNKALSYDANTDEYKLTVNVNTDKLYPMETPSQTYWAYEDSSTFTAPVDGYYLIKAWGGKGGNGGDADASGDGDSYKGGTGAVGGYAYNLVYLNKNETCSVTVGTNGNNGSNTSGTRENCNGGNGGTYSAVIMPNGTVALVAAGGGAGGGACKHLSYTGANGNSASANTTLSPVASISLSTSYNGGNGGKGDHSLTNSKGGSAGSSPASAYNSSINKYSELVNSYKTIVDNNIAYATNGSGFVGISFVQPKIVVDSEIKTDLSEITVSATLSDYFTATSATSLATTDDDITITINNSGKIGHINKAYEITFKAKDSFLGGNDVPVFADGTNVKISQKVGTKDTSEVTMTAKDTTDYANVAMAKFNTENARNSNANAIYSGVTATDKVVELGEAIAIVGTSNELFNETAVNTSKIDPSFQTTSRTILKDGVEYDEDLSNFIVTSNSDFTYNYNLSPVAAATKAIVGPSVTTTTNGKDASITIAYKVTVNETNATIIPSDESILSNGTCAIRGLSAEINGAAGYGRPTSVTVTIDGTPYTGFTYENGQLSIPATDITGNVVIAASGILKTYNVTYMYSKDVNNTTTGEIIDDNNGAGYVAGDTVTFTLPNDAPTELKPGYEFKWDSSITPNESSQFEMPAYDVFFIGFYQPITYTVKINYIDAANNTIKETSEYKLPYGYEGVLDLSAKITGTDSHKYILTDLEKASVNIDLKYTDNDTNDTFLEKYLGENNVVEYNAIYELATAELNVVYKDYATGKVIKVDNVTYEEEANYSYSILTNLSSVDEKYIPANYTPYLLDTSGEEATLSAISAPLSGKMPADGVTETVYMVANRYEINFVTGKTGASVDSAIVAYSGTLSETYTSINPTDLENATIQNLPTAYCDGYVFEGWYTDSECTDGNEVSNSTNVADVIEDGNIVLYAKWSTSKYKVNIIIKSQDGELLFKDYAEAEWNGKGTKITYTFPTTNEDYIAATTGYTYKEIASFTLPDNTIVSATDKSIITTLNSVGDRYVYVTYAFDKYTLTYDFAGGSTSTPENEYTHGDVDYKATIVAPADPEREHYSFNGWSQDIPSTMPANDLTIAATWLGDEFKVTFDANEGTCGTTSKDVNYGSAYGTLPTATRTGYTFDGWYTSKTGGTEVTKDTVVEITENQTLFAHWTENTYTIVFNANGGTGTTESMVDVKYSEVVNLTENAFTKTGYTFKGWATSEGSTSVTYADKAEVSSLTSTDKGVVELYAVWAANKFTIKFIANLEDAVGSMSDLEVTYNSDTKLAKNAFSKENFVFLGWAESALPLNSEPAYTDEAAAGTICSEDGATITLYGVWSGFIVDGNVTLDVEDTSVQYSDNNEATVDTSDLVIPETGSIISYKWYNGDELLAVTTENTFNTSGLNVGEYALKCGVSIHDSLTGVTVVKTTNVKNVKIDKKDVIIQIDNATMSLGENEPTYSFSVSGCSKDIINTTTAIYANNFKNEVGKYDLKGVFAIKNGYENNYTIKTVNDGKLTISEAEFDKNTVKATITPASPNGSNSWYNTVATASAPSGYKISESQTGSWTDTITKEDGDYSNFTYYLRKVDTGAISSAYNDISYKQDCNSSEAKITIDTSFWNELLEAITFGIYKSDKVNVKIEATDSLSGVSTIFYLKSASALTVAQLNDAAWTVYNGDFDISATDNEKFVIYVKVVDIAGNVKYISSNGHVFDLTAPVITVTSETDATTENNGTTYADRTVTVTDVNLEKVEVTSGGATTTKSIADGVSTFTIPNDGKTYTITATDKVGKTTTYVINTKTIDDFLNEIKDDSIDERLEAIEELLDAETTDNAEPSNLTEEEIEKLLDEQESLLENKEAADSFIETYLLDDGDYPEDADSVYNEATKDNKDQIMDGSDVWDALPDDAKKYVNNAIANSEYATGDNTVDNYPALLAKAETIDADQQAIADKFVQDYASNNNKTTPYNKDTVSENNYEQIISGKDTYDAYDDDIKEKINDLINKGEDNSYENYPEMLTAAEEVKLGLKADDILEALDELTDLTDAEKQEYINAINEIVDNYSDNPGTTTDDIVNNEQTAEDALDAIIQQAEENNLENSKDKAKEDIQEYIKEAIEDIENDPNLTDDQKDEFIEELEDLLDEALDDIDDATTPEGVKEIINNTKELSDDISDEADDTSIAQKFVNDYLSGDDNDPYDKKDDKVTKDNSEQIISGSEIPADGEKSPYDELTDNQKDIVNTIINAPTTDETEYTEDIDTYETYEEMLADAEKVVIDEYDDDADDIIDSLNNLSDEEKTEYKERIADAAKDAKDDIDSKDNINDIKKAESDGEGEIDKIIEEARQKDADNLQNAKDNAIEEINNKKNEVIEEINNLPDLTDEEKQELINEVNKIAEEAIEKIEEEETIEDVKDDKKEATDDFNDMSDKANDVNIAQKFVTDYASVTKGDPYDKNNDPVDESNIDQIISGSLIPDGEIKSPYDQLTDKQKEIVNDLIKTTHDDDESEYVDGTDTYNSYEEMLAAANEILQNAKDEEKNNIDEMEKEAEEVINNLPGLTDEEKQELIDELKEEAEKAKKDIDDADTLEEVDEIVEETEDVFEDTLEDGVAEDFVNRHASDGNIDPYDKENDKLENDDNRVDKVITGEEEYNELSPSIQEKINNIISTPTDDETSYDDNDTYNSYEEMLTAAKDIVSSTKDDSKKDLDEVAKEAKSVIDNLPGLSNDEKQELKDQIDEKIQEAKDNIDKEDTDTIEKIYDIKNEAEDAIVDIYKDAKALDFVNRHASDDDKNTSYDEADPYDKTNDDFVTEPEKTDRVLSGEDEYNNLKKDSELVEKINDLINKQKDAEDNYESYEEMLESAKDALNEQKDDAKDKIDNAANEAIEEIEKLDNLSDEEKQDLINEIKEEAENAKAKIDEAENMEDANSEKENGLEEIENILKEGAKEDVDKAAEKAKDAIDNMDGLSNEEKQDAKNKIDEDVQNAKNAIDNAENNEAIENAKNEGEENILNGLKKDAENNIDNLAQEAKDAIDQMEDLSDEEKQAAKDKIDSIANKAKDTIENAKSIKDVAKTNEQTEKDILNNVKENAKKDIDKHAEEAKALIDEIDNISEKDKQKYKDEIDKAAKNAKNNIDAAENIEGVMNAFDDGIKEIDDIVKRAAGLDDIIKDMIKDNYIRIEIKSEGTVNLGNGDASSEKEIKEILGHSLTYDDIKLAQNGGHVEIVMTIKEIASDAFNEACIAADKHTLVKHIQIIITKTAYDESGKRMTQNEVNEVYEPITFSVPLGEYAKEDRIFHVYCDHSDYKPDVLLDEDGKTATVTFSSQRYSVFSLAYVNNTNLPGGDDEKIVQTNDPSALVPMFALFVTSGLVFIYTRKKRDEEPDEVVE